jgi:hypothetical protein
MKLLDLPKEILHHILDFCARESDTKHTGPNSTIRSFSLVSKQAHDYAQPSLWCQFSLASDAHVTKLARSLDTESSRRGHVKSLNLVPSNRTGTTYTGYKKITTSLLSLTNLSSISIEFPTRYSHHPGGRESWNQLKGDFGEAGECLGIGQVPIPPWSQRLVTCKYC